MSTESNKSVRDLYIDLTKKCLLDSLYGEFEYKPVRKGGKAFNWVNKYLQWRGLVACERRNVRNEARYEGKDWPARALSMIGVKRLNNLQECVEKVIQGGVAGDFIETGVWRGGSTILMKAVLKAYGDTTRIVWVADSFEGLPEPNPDLYPADTGDQHHTHQELAVSMEEVMDNFRRFGLLDDRVKFLKGWFKDTLPSAPVKELALMRLDGDMYESTMDALVALYPKLSVGGFVIVDDYGCIEACKQAVHDYRNKNNIRDEIITIDWTGVYWRKSGRTSTL
jgi:O-methyltransferase